jgi:hypothetical protein
VSEARRLWIRFRLVDSAERSGYRDAVAAAGVLAGEVGAHFWAFEVDGEAGRFVEFLEGPEDVALTRLDELTRAPLAAEGSLVDEGWSGVDGLRCTELRDSSA